MKPTRNQSTNKAAANRKQIVLARLRGGSLAECAAACGVSKGYASKILTAFVSQVESGIVDDVPEGPDPVLRWQIARAEKTELEAKQMRRDLFPVAVIRDQCQRIAKHLRSAQKRLDRECKNCPRNVESATIVREALEAARREEREFEQ